jgi:hypothetical protein
MKEADKVMLGVGIAAVAGIGVAAYLLMQQPIPTQRSVPFACDGANGAIQPDEAVQNPTHPCWGALHTHTYHFGASLQVTQVSGFVTTGTSSPLPGTLNVQLSADGVTWVTIGTAVTSNSTGGYPFSIALDEPMCAAHLRFIGTTNYPAPSCCVDGSSGVVTYINLC